MNPGFDALFHEHLASSSPLPQQLEGLRHGAFQRFRAGELPQRKQENWRYSSVTGLMANTFTLRAPAFDEATVQRLMDQVALNEESRIVLVNGRYQSHLSTNDEAVTGISVEDLRTVVARTLEDVPMLLTSDYTNQDGDALFAHLGRAFLRDGIVIRARAGVQSRKTVHLIHVHTVGSAVGFVPVTQIIEVGAGASLTLLESLVAESGSTCFSYVTTRIQVHSGGHFAGHLIHEPSRCSYHMMDTSLAVERDAQASFYHFSRGARLYRVSLNVKIKGEGAHVDLSGVNVLTQDAHVDYNVDLEHLAPRAVSRQLFKNVLKGCSHAAFAGHIRVAHVAQKTDAHQLVRALLLDSTTQASARPQLYIDADDVKCSHGATTGRLQPEQLFYLQSRGLDKKSAELMLSTAFAGETIAKITDETIKQRVSQLIAQTLTH